MYVVRSPFGVVLFESFSKSSCCLYAQKHGLDPDLVVMRSDEPADYLYDYDLEGDYFL